MSEPEPLELALERIREAERRRMGRTSARLRLACVLGFFVATAYAAYVQHDLRWRLYPPALGGVLVIAVAMLYAHSRLEVRPRLRALSAFLDITIAFAAQFQSLRYFQRPAVPAAFAPFVFAMFVTRNNSQLSGAAYALCAGYAGACATWILFEAGIGALAPMTLVTLALIAAAAWMPRRHHAFLTAELARSEVDRQVERKMREQTASSKRTIEHLLQKERENSSRLAQLQREKEQLTQLIVHDLRNPLASVRSAVEVVKIACVDRGDDPTQLPILEQSAAVLARLEGMVGEILSIAGLEEGRLQVAPTAVTLSDLLQEVIDDYRQLALSKSVHLSISNAEPTAWLDRALVRRMLENLVANAMRFVPEGGRVRLEALRGDAWLELRCQNDGPAIPAAVKATLFERFTRGTQEPQHGFGLGLYFCRLVAEAHGGSMSVVDCEGWACTMEARLPVALPAPQ